MGRGTHGLALLLACGLASSGLVQGCRDDTGPQPADDTEGIAEAQGPLNPALVAEGRQIFRFETYGNETFWTDSLELHEVIQASVTPEAALGLGLKVDMDALPPEVVAGITDGSIPLDEPSTTVALLELGAVVGVVGTVDDADNLTSVGITCALCHSTVDNAFTDGIGHRLDGWPNRDLDVGKVVTLSQSEHISDAARLVYNGWGPGMYDPRFNQDEQNHPVVMPPAFGLRHVAKEIYTGDDVVSYWNLYVAVTQMHGHGTFEDDRIGVSISNPPDLVSSKLDALRAYQFSLRTPAPQPRSYDVAAAQRGKAVFNGVAKCQECHRGSTYTDINSGELHDPDEVGQDATYALRSATKQYRTTPLRGLWNPPQLDGPYFHDGSATTLEDVVDHYVTVFGLSLTAQQRADLVEYLKSL